MRAICLAGFGCAATVMSSVALAEPIPPPVAAMITAASDSGDAAALKSTIDLAKKTNPDSKNEIDDLAANLAKAAEEKRVAKLESETFFQGWKGEGQAGASLTTGNTQGRATSTGLKLEKETLQWKNLFQATADYTKQNDVVSQNRDTASYEADYKFNDRWYALGVVGWEHDPFAGFDRRLSESFGAGYNVIKTPTTTWSVEAGPGFRQTHYVTGDRDSKVGLRLATNYSWTISPSVTLTESAVYYAQTGDSTLTSTTALTAKIYGALSLQASFLYNHEQQPPIGTLDKTDTTTRLSLVYSF
jgi:putative salt-induced outer membrane protein